MENALSHRDDGFFTQTLAEALTDAAFIDELVDCFMAVFNASGEGEWQEAWTVESVRNLLINDAPQNAHRVFLATWREGGALAGFSLVEIGGFDEVLRLSDLPPNHRTVEHLEGVKRQIEWLAGPKPVIVNQREIGIRQEFRKGLEPIVRLLLDPMERGPEDAYICNWTSRKAKLMPIILAMDVRVVYDFKDEAQHVFIGEDVKHLRRRLRSGASSVGLMMKERRSHLAGPSSP